MNRPNRERRVIAPMAVVMRKQTHHLLPFSIAAKKHFFQPPPRRPGSLWRTLPQRAPSRTSPNFCAADPCTSRINVIAMLFPFGSFPFRNISRSTT
jgi:hypothetical protein